jgi:oligoendopeptidase F
VASTFNEALLIDYMLKKLDDDETRLSLLMEYLDGLKGTVFRQTQFAEFELRIHEMVEKGEALTGENLTEIYAEIVRKYYGHDKGICLINDLYTFEWAYIPHFYYNYYVYQYSTSFCASTALAERVLNNEPGAKESFLKFISAGGSDYPIAILNQAGVDMTTADPFNKTMQQMNRVMDEIEKILDKK